MEPASESSHIPTLHDYFPQKIYMRGIWRIFTTWMIFLGIEIGLLIIRAYSSMWWAPVVIILFILNIIAPLTLIIYINIGRVLTLWDNLDYTGLNKQDFPFTTSDGKKLFAYRYSPVSIDVDVDPTPRPTIIGIHGWNSHHREMDRYCLPSVKEENCLYFTYDARGQGQSPGNRNDFFQFEEETKEFIACIKSLSYVDKTRIVVMGMSMGSNRSALAAYPDPEIKLLVLVSGPYDLKLTRSKLTLFPRIMYRLFGMKLDYSEEEYAKYSGITRFQPDGIVLAGNTEPTPNKDRVFMAASIDDPIVTVECARDAIKKLQLPPENYRIFKHGGHTFESDEWFLGVAIYRFIATHL